MLGYHKISYRVLLSERCSLEQRYTCILHVHSFLEVTGISDLPTKGSLTFLECTFQQRSDLMARFGYQKSSTLLFGRSNHWCELEVCLVEPELLRTSFSAFGSKLRAPVPAYLRTRDVVLGRWRPSVPSLPVNLSNKRLHCLKVWPSYYSSSMTSSR